MEQVGADLLAGNAVPEPGFSTCADQHGASIGVDGDGAAHGAVAFL